MKSLTKKHINFFENLEGSEDPWKKEARQCDSKSQFIDSVASLHPLLSENEVRNSMPTDDWNSFLNDIDDNIVEFIDEVYDKFHRKLWVKNYTD